jgi:competence protein ComEA
MGTPADVMDRLRLRARLTAGEARRLAEDGGAAHARPRLRGSVTRWAVIGVAMVAAGVAGWFIAGAWNAGHASGPAPASPIIWEETAPLLEEPQLVVVYITGAVAEPGVFELAEGSRVVDGIERAGGALDGADLTVLNLAAVVVDGERIYVPLVGETPPAVVSGGSGSSGGGGGSGSGGAVGSGGGGINVNTAGVEELTQLPGIGPVLAQRIVDFREANGNFGELADLGEVTGIGPKVLAGLADAVTF